MRLPGGESLQEPAARTADVVRLMLERHPSHTVVLICHDSGTRTMLLQLLDQPLSAYWRLSPHPCGISEVEAQGHTATIITINTRTHLS